MKKNCFKCKVEKPLNCFSNDKDKNDGKCTYCRKCRKTMKRIAYLENIKKHTSKKTKNKYKICSKCKKEKELKLFTKRKDMADGCGNFCQNCIRKKKKRTYRKNIKSRRIAAKKYYLKNKKKINAIHKIWRSNNKNWEKNKRKKDYLFKLKKNIRSLIFRAFKNNNHKKESKTVDILGCSVEHFKLYIEKQLEVWMSWNNYGKYNPNGEKTWQLDHKIPVTHAGTIEVLINLNHYTNFRPLSSLENILKRDKIVLIEKIHPLFEKIIG